MMMNEVRRLSIMVRMLPLDGGRPVTKSRDMCDQRQMGVGRGWSREEVGLVDNLFWEQSKQAVINSLIYFSMVGGGRQGSSSYQDGRSGG